MCVGSSATNSGDLLVLGVEGRWAGTSRLVRSFFCRHGEPPQCAFCLKTATVSHEKRERKKEKTHKEEKHTDGKEGKGEMGKKETTKETEKEKGEMGKNTKKGEKSRNSTRTKKHITKHKMR